MKRYNAQGITVEMTAGTNLQDADCAIAVAKHYDHYVGAIDDGGQYRDALRANKQRLEQLKEEYGVAKVTWHNHQAMFSSTVEDLTFDLLEEA